MARVSDRRSPRSSAVATGRPRVLLIGGDPKHVRKPPEPGSTRRRSFCAGRSRVSFRRTSTRSSSNRPTPQSSGKLNGTREIGPTR